LLGEGESVKKCKRDNLNYERVFHLYNIYIVLS
jgi:hypothetical protein